MERSQHVKFYFGSFTWRKKGNDAGFVVSGTMAEMLAGWDAVVWSADARGFAIRIDLWRVVSLEKSFPIIKLNLLSLFSVFLSRAPRLPGMLVSIVIYLILAKQLARHPPWFCRSGNFIILLHVCDSLLVFDLYCVFNQNAITFFHQAIDDRDSNGLSASWQCSVCAFCCLVLSFLLLPFCQLLSISLCARSLPRLVWFVDAWHAIAIVRSGCVKVFLVVYLTNR